MPKRNFGGKLPSQIVTSVSLTFWVRWMLVRCKIVLSISFSFLWSYEHHMTLETIYAPLKVFSSHFLRAPKWGYLLCSPLSFLHCDPSSFSLKLVDYAFFIYMYARHAMFVEMIFSNKMSQQWIIGRDIGSQTVS